MAHTRALVFWNNFQGKGNFAAVGCVSEHARVIPCVIEESRPEPKGAVLLVTLWLCAVPLGSGSERCDDWGVDTMKQIQIYDGEPAKIKFPLFETFLKYNLQHSPILLA